MNESELENELRALQPRPASPQLAARIAEDLEASPDATLQSLVVVPTFPVNGSRRAGVLSRSQRRIPWWSQALGWALTGAAAAVMVLVWSSSKPQPAPRLVAAATPTPTSVASEILREEPDESESELIASEDEGLVYDEEAGTPQRQLRMVYLERHIWTNPHTGAVIEIEVPREDIVRMPVAMQ